MVQIRHVPDDLHRRLKARAAHAGMSLSDYLLKEMEQVAQKATLQEIFQRLDLEQPVQVSISAEAIIREARGKI